MKNSGELCQRDFRLRADGMDVQAERHQELLAAIRDVKDAFASLPSNPQEPEPLLRIEQVAELLACDERTVRRKEADGEFPRAIRIGGMVRWSPKAIKDFIEQGGQV